LADKGKTRKNEKRSEKQEKERKLNTRGLGNM